MLKIRLRKNIMSTYKTYDIILAKALSKNNAGRVIVLGFYIPSQKLINLNKIKFTHAINNGAQLTNSARHLVKKYLNNLYLNKYVAQWSRVYSYGL